MSYIDEKYIKLVGSKLTLFKDKGNGVYQFRCPYCGDSKKSKTKARGYIYSKKDTFNFKCQNCGHSTSFKRFLKEQDFSLYSEYLKERFTGKFKKQKPQKKALKVPNKPYQKILQGVQCLLELPEYHSAIKYANNRKIPQTFWADIYYVPDINILASQIKKYNLTKFDSEERIILPFRNEKNIITHIQGRAINPVDKRFRYVTLELVQDCNKIFGLNRLDKTKRIFVVEGPLDSFFIQNCIAMGGADVNLTGLDKKNTVFIYDNEKTKEILKRVAFRISEGYSVMIWDNSIPKSVNDINDLVLYYDGNMTKVENYINTHIYSGLTAKLKLIEFSKR